MCPENPELITAFFKAFRNLVTNLWLYYLLGIHGYLKCQIFRLLMGQLVLDHNLRLLILIHILVVCSKKNSIKSHDQLCLRTCIIQTKVIYCTYFFYKVQGTDTASLRINVNAWFHKRITGAAIDFQSVNCFVRESRLKGIGVRDIFNVLDLNNILLPFDGGLNMFL